MAHHAHGGAGQRGSLDGAATRLVGILGHDISHAGRQSPGVPRAIIAGRVDAVGDLRLAQPRGGAARLPGSRRRAALGAGTSNRASSIAGSATWTLRLPASPAAGGFKWRRIPITPWRESTSASTMDRGRRCRAPPGEITRVPAPCRLSAVVRFRARALAGDAYLSDGYAWPGGTPLGLGSGPVAGPGIQTLAVPAGCAHGCSTGRLCCQTGALTGGSEEDRKYSCEVPQGGMCPGPDLVVNGFRSRGLLHRVRDHPRPIRAPFTKAASTAPGCAGSCVSRRSRKITATATCSWAVRRTRPSLRASSSMLATRTTISWGSRRIVSRPCQRAGGPRP